MDDQSWRRPNSCGACIHFTVDYGDSPTFYGHCKMHTRHGSRSSRDAICREFSPLPGFELVSMKSTDTQSSRDSRDDRVRRAAPPSIRRRADSAPTITRRRAAADTAPTQTRISSAAPSAPPAPEPPASAPPTPTESPFLADSPSADPRVLGPALLDVVESFVALSEPRINAYEGGKLVFLPGDGALKAHEMSLEAFFHKFVMVRDRLRVLEQRVNSHAELSILEKITLQAPITRLYGAMTAFNSLMRPTSPEWRRRRPTRRPLEELLRHEAPRESLELAAKWEGGEVRIETEGGDDQYTRLISIDLFFERVIRLRRRLRQLARQISDHPKLSVADKDLWLDYLAKSQGSLTSLNILFRHREDTFSSK